MNWRPHSAMILGAGLGSRMRPLTDHVPKPMVPFNASPLIDHILDRMAKSGIEEVVVNVHYLADALEGHLAARDGRPKVLISDERDELLDTGGGINRALPMLGREAFLIHNSDSLSHEPNRPNLDILFDAWRDDDMDTLLLLAPTGDSLGYDGAGDFELDDKGQISRPEAQSDTNAAPYVFTGLSIAHPRLFNNAPKGAFSLNRLWTKAIDEGRAYGVIHQGLWMHIGTPQALSDAEDATRT